MPASVTAIFRFHNNFRTFENNLGKSLQLNGKIVFQAEEMGFPRAGCPLFLTFRRQKSKLGGELP